MDDEDARLQRARLGTMLATLQSLDLFMESLSDWIAPADHGGWVVVSLLEAWKALCRLRLLCTLDRGQLLCSFGPESEEEGESLMSVVRRLRQAASPFQLRAMPPPLNARAIAIQAGEVLHVIQPLIFALLLLAQQRGVHFLATGWRRRLPWLTALGLEAIALQLCTLGARGPRQSSMLASSHAADNARELAHRRLLLALFLVRPAARHAIKTLLLAVAGRRRPSHRRSLLAAWSTSALELVDHLETQSWARYFRTCERLHQRVD
jgi:hypothetical protein